MTDNIRPEHYRKGEFDLYEAFSKIFPHNEYRAGMQMIAMRYMFRDKIDRVEDLDKCIETLRRLKEKEIEHAGGNDSVSDIVREHLYGEKNEKIMYDVVVTTNENKFTYQNIEVENEQELTDRIRHIRDRIRKVLDTEIVEIEIKKIFGDGFIYD